MAETCMNKYVQTLSHSSQQKIRNTTGEKKREWKGKKCTTCPHHACTQISSYWGHQRSDRVHDYWIQPEAFSKVITKHRCKERIKQKRKQILANKTKLLKLSSTTKPQHLGQEHVDLISLNYKSTDVKWNPIKPVTLGLLRVYGGEKNQRREMQRVKGRERCREQREGAECYFRFRVRKHHIYTCFFFKC